MWVSERVEASLLDISSVWLCDAVQRFSDSTCWRKFNVVSMLLMQPVKSCRLSLLSAILDKRKVVDLLRRKYEASELVGGSGDLRLSISFKTNVRGSVGPERIISSVPRRTRRFGLAVHTIQCWQTRLSGEPAVRREQQGVHTSSNPQTLLHKQQ